MSSISRETGGDIRKFHPAFYILGILLVIQIRGDGYFPFSKSWPQERLLLIVLVHWIALVTLVALSVKALLRGGGQEESRSSFLPVMAVGIIPAGSVIGIFMMHILQAGYFSHAGYRGDTMSILTGSFLSLLPIGGYWIYSRLKGHHTPVTFLSCVLLCVIILKCTPLNLFPVTAVRSDLLPIVQEGASSILKGESPYRFYLLDNGVNTPNVRFPGTLLAYLPAVAAGVDLRFVTIALESAIFIILIFRFRQVWKGNDDSGPFGELIVILVCFMMFPYWHYRHELYESPFWLALLLTLLAFDRGSVVGVSFGLAGMLITHHWGILFGPYLLIGFFKKKNVKAASACFLAGVFFAMAVVFTLLKGDLRPFFLHAFGTYGTFDYVEAFYPMSMYLSAWFARFGWFDLLLPLKAATQLPILYLIWRYGDKTSALAGILALSLTLVLMFNPVAWTYQYLLVTFLLIVGWLFNENYRRSVNRSANF